MNCILPFLLFTLVLAGCSAQTPEASGELAFYQPVEPVSGREILAANLDSLELQEQPLIEADEIVGYTQSSHDLEVTPEVVERLAAMKVPMDGVGFVACLGETPLFAGAIWTPVSSLSFDGVTIEIPLGMESTRVHLYSGYPGVDQPLPDDPRDDERMLEALDQAGKLIKDKP
jgi:hypothetical protein